MKLLKGGIIIDDKRYISLATTPGLMKKSGLDYSCEYFFVDEADKDFINVFYDVGIIIDDKRYISLATTPGLMKKSGLDYSCEYFFVDEADKDFINVFYDVISLGKLKEKYNNYLCINKDIVSRVSLAFSSGDHVHINCKKAILPEMTYTYINNYLQFAENINVFYDVISLGKLKEKYNNYLCINKDIVSRVSLAFSSGDHVHINCKKAILPEMTYTYINNYLQFAENENGKIDLDNLRLEKHHNKEVEHIAMDGSGFMMPVIADKIEKKLNLKYPLSWIGIRELGVASKGLLVKFDFKKYLKEEHGLDKLIVKDAWGDDIDLFEVDVIMNESQVKWGKFFKNRDEIEELKKLEKYKPYSKLLDGFTITKINKEHPKKYTEANYQILSNLNLTPKELDELSKETEDIYLLDGFTITKINKEHPKKYTEANYQILSNLNLTPKELDELSKETEDIYNRVINGDIDAIRIMLGDVARENEEQVLSASTKLH